MHQLVAAKGECACRQSDYISVLAINTMYQTANERRLATFRRKMHVCGFAATATADGSSPANDVKTQLLVVIKINERTCA
jgi:hypothetical protein